MILIEKLRVKCKKFLFSLKNRTISIKNFELLKEGNDTNKTQEIIFLNDHF